MFNTVREIYPNFEEKISAIQGDILDPNFGLNSTDENLLIEHCQIVFHSAATVRFHEPLRYKKKKKQTKLLFNYD